MVMRKSYRVTVILLLSLLFSLWASGVAAQEPAITETFDNPELPGWERSPGSIVRSGSLVVEPGNIAFLPIASASITIRVQQTGNAHLQIHYQRTDGSAYILNLRPDGMAVIREELGQMRELNGTDLGLPPARWVTVSISLKELEHRIQIPELGVDFTLVDDEPLAPGGLLLRVEGEGSGSFDDLILNDIYDRAQAPEEAVPDAVITESSEGEPVLSEEDVDPERQWIYCGGPSGGLGYDIRMHPLNHDLLYVSDGKTGVFKSEDRGHSWTPANHGITTRMGASSDEIPVFSVTIDPNNPERLWAGTQYSSGIYRSDDGGGTWTMMNSGLQEKFISVRGFTVEPGDSNVVYMAGEVSSWEWNGEPLPGLGLDQTKGVVYKTTDAGQHWRRIWYGDNLARYIWVNPQNADLIYVSTGIFDREAANAIPETLEPGGVGILRSHDGGQTWEILGSEHGFDPLDLYIGSLYMHPEDPAILYAAAGNGVYGPTGGLYRTLDGGDHWQELLDVHSMSIVEICESNPDVIYAGSVNVLYRSTDAGETWTQPNPEQQFWGPEGIPAGFPIDAQCDFDDPDRLLINNYVGGAFISEDGGKTWTNSSQGYTGAMMSQISLFADSPAQLYASARSGLFLSVDGCDHWQGIARGPARTLEGLAIEVDPFDPLHVLTTLADAGPGPKLTWDGGANWAGVDPGFWRPEDFGRVVITRFSFDPGRPGRVLASVQPQHCFERMWCAEPPGEGLILSDDGGLTWRRSSLTAGNVTALAYSSADGGVWFAALYQEGLYQSDDGGDSWNLINPEPFPPTLDLSRIDPDKQQEVMIRALAIDPVNANKIYAGIFRNGVAVSDNGGRSWTASSAGLPPETLSMDILLDPIDREVLYLGTLDSGMFISKDAAGTWQAMNTGLINRSIEDLEISADGQVIYASTEGAGVFRLGDAPEASPLPSSDEAVPDESVEDIKQPLQPSGLEQEQTGKRQWCPGSYLPIAFSIALLWQVKRRTEKQCPG